MPDGNIRESESCCISQGRMGLCCMKSQPYTLTSDLTKWKFSSHSYMSAADLVSLWDNCPPCIALWCQPLWSLYLVVWRFPSWSQGKREKLGNCTSNEMLQILALEGTRATYSVLDMASSLLYNSCQSSPLIHFYFFSPTQHTVGAQWILEGEGKSEHTILPDDIYSSNAHSSPRSPDLIKDIY